MAAMSTDPQSREHDVVVFGATGFVGKLTAAYLVEHAPPGTRIALAGRSAEKLARVREELGPRAAGCAVVVADSHDEAAITALARSARVVATTVGPYLQYGMPLVEACAAAGTHYADLTGETCSCAARSTPPTRRRRRAARASSTRAASTRSRPTSASSCSTSTPARPARATSRRRRSS
jgi:saccharopine dehydrogenase-like NADP-dependent oxidoreductase